MQKSLQNEINDEKKKQMTTEFLSFYAKNIDRESKPLKGSIDFLNWAQKNNILLAVCTNKQEKLAIDLLKKLKMYDFWVRSWTWYCWI